MWASCSTLQAGLRGEGWQGQNSGYCTGARKGPGWEKLYPTPSRQSLIALDHVGHSYCPSQGDFTYSAQMNVNLDKFQMVSSLESGRVPGHVRETGVVCLDTAPDLDEEGGKMMGRTSEEGSDLQWVQKRRAGQSLKVHPGKGCPV